MRAQDETGIPRQDTTGATLHEWRVTRGFTEKQAAHHLGLAVKDYREFESCRTMTLRTVPIDRLPIYPA